MKGEIEIEDCYVIELQEYFSSCINDKDYAKGKRLIAWEDEQGFRVLGNYDFIPRSLVKKIYKATFTKIAN